MSYDFSFDKKSVLFILGGSVAIGVLLFFAGFIMGWDRGEYAARLDMENSDGSSTAQKQPASGKPAVETAALAKPQAQTKSTAESDSAQPKPVSAPQAKETSATPAAPEAKPEQPSAAAASESKPEKPVSATSPPKPPEQTAAQAAPEKSAPEKPSPSQAASSGADPAAPDAEQSAFSLQLGAFQDEHNAVRFKNDLKSRGYPVFVFHTLDAGGRIWHTVRLGHYPDMKKASEAATVFVGKEKIPAFVRPGNEL
ncbi:MAG TPA: SPOR domain-containing protein [Candidatus Angelobacter sp.]